MINPLTFLGGLSLQTKALMIVGVFLSGLYAGWTIHDWKTEARQGVSINQQIKTSDTIAADSKKEVKQTQETLVKEKIVYRTIRERIQDENDTRICFADATALQLWNDAIAGADQHRPVIAREAREASAVVANVEQVLTNAATNFEICRANSIKHNALIDRVEALNGKMCVCSE